MKSILVLSLLILFGSMLANTSTAEEATIAQGQKVFQQYCAFCHGIKGVGQDPTKPGGGFTHDNKFIAPALNGTGHTWHHHPKFLFQQIKNRKVNKTSPMPPFANILSDDELHAVLTYVKSLWPKDIRQQYFEKFGE